MQKSERAAVCALLAAASLPTAGLESCWGTTLVAVQAETVVGSVALEVHGVDGVLRSLCVAESHRGQRLGQRLVARVLELAHACGVRNLYLLTETAADFFPRFGFERVMRDTAPEPIRRSVEFAGLCPASATAMMAPIRAPESGTKKQE